MSQELKPIKALSSDAATASSNTAVVITYTAIDGLHHAIQSLVVSYDGAPTGGSVKIEDGAGTTVFQVAITASGPTIIPFPRPLMGSQNKALVVTLAAGGSGVTGRVNVQHTTH